MPIYVYKCEKCQGEFELLRKIEKREEPANCPVKYCGGEGKPQATAVRFQRSPAWASRVDTPMPQTEDRT